MSERFTECERENACESFLSDHIEFPIEEQKQQKKKYFKTQQLHTYVWKELKLKMRENFFFVFFFAVLCCAFSYKTENSVVKKRRKATTNFKFILLLLA